MAEDENKDLRDAAVSIKNEVLESLGALRDKLSGDIEVAALNSLSSGFLHLKDKIENADDSLKNLSIAALFLSEKYTDRFPITSGMIELGSASKDVTANIYETSKAIQTLIMGSKGIGSGEKNEINGRLDELAKRSEYAKNLETEIIRGAAASGELESLIGSSGDRFADMGKKVEQFSRMTNVIGTSTATTSDQVGKYANRLKTITGAMDLEVNIGTGDSTRDLHMLEAVIKTSQGTMRDTTSVIDDLKWSYDQFGTTGEESLKTVTRMTSAANDLKMPFDMVHELVKSSSEGFKFLGDNTQSTIDIMGRLAPSLREAGYGPKVISDLTSGVIKGIQGMSVAQKAFLSNQSSETGFTGGLQGAFKIDQLTREGKTGQVEEMVMKSLMQQMGGNIVNLDQAASSEQAAAQMQKQIALLTSGPTKIAEGRDQAIALIEAFSKEGTLNVKNETLRGEDRAMSDAMQMSDVIADKQLNSLISIENDIRYIASVQSVAGLESMRGLDKVIDGVFESRSNARIESQHMAGSKLYSGKGREEGGRTVSDAMFDKGEQAIRSGLQLPTVIFDFFKKTQQTAESQPVPTYQTVSQNESKAQQKYSEQPTSANTNMQQGSHTNATGKLALEITPVCASCMTKMTTQTQTAEMIQTEINKYDNNRNQTSGVST